MKLISVIVLRSMCLSISVASSYFYASSLHRHPSLPPFLLDELTLRDEDECGRKKQCCTLACKDFSGMSGGMTTTRSTKDCATQDAASRADWFSTPDLMDAACEASALMSAGCDGQGSWSYSVDSRVHSVCGAEREHWTTEAVTTHCRLQAHITGAPMLAEFLFSEGLDVPPDIVVPLLWNDKHAHAYTVAALPSVVQFTRRDRYAVQRITCDIVKILLDHYNTVLVHHPNNRIQFEYSTFLQGSQCVCFAGGTSCNPKVRLRIPLDVSIPSAVEGNRQAEGKTSTKPFALRLMLNPHDSYDTVVVEQSTVVAVDLAGDGLLRLLPSHAPFSLDDQLINYIPSVEDHYQRCIEMLVQRQEVLKGFVSVYGQPLETDWSSYMAFLCNTQLEQQFAFVITVKFPPIGGDPTANGESETGSALGFAKNLFLLSSAPPAARRDGLLRALTPDVQITSVAHCYAGTATPVTIRVSNTNNTTASTGSDSTVASSIVNNVVRAVAQHETKFAQCCSLQWA